MFSPDQGEPHEYVQILEEERCENQACYINRLKQKHTDIHPYDAQNLRKGSEILVNARLQADGLVAECSVLTRVEGKSALGKYSYEPTICMGTHTISKEQKLELSFVGYVLERIQIKPPVAGTIIGMNGSSHTVKLENGSKDLLPILEPLQEWIVADSPEPPPIVLNKHCPLCPFQQPCQAQAEREDNLSLLNGVTPRVMRQYERKGIFTVRQLSYLFKPRKRKKRSRNPPPVTHKVELQALAIRENKIYLQELPEIARQPVELFLDIEGIPDRGIYYLIGLLVCEGDTTEHHSFWADTDQEEASIWQKFVDKAIQYPDAPIYHYGSYEPRAIATLARRYQTDGASLTKRLVNVNGFIYGKVYFPVRSNGLKDVCTFIGAKWTSPNASGLQSLVWRHQWELIQGTKYQEILITYNEEDCKFLKILTDELSKIKDSADTLSEVDFANKPKRHATEVSEYVHDQFKVILKFAHTGYDKNKISFHKNEISERIKPGQKEGSKRNKNPSYKVTNLVQIPTDTTCPKHENILLYPLKQKSERLIINLVLTRNGIRKAVTKYVGFLGRCSKCNRCYAPSGIMRYDRSQRYDHQFKAYVAYQRVDLCLPYRKISESIHEHFNINVPWNSIINIIQDISSYYVETEELIIQRILESPFIHADETTINIRGSDQYVWVFTDGNYVVFKLTDTREATIVHEILKNYKGILISDFYPGYDSVQCRQQKCWAHLVRDLNDDLWQYHYDAELESFVISVRNMIIPIMKAVQKYGLKKRNLNKFIRQVDEFYKQYITGKIYYSELVIKYQNRFIRYRESLFTFLEHDGIPWHNNTAETAIRHVAKQRQISGVLHESVTHDYLRLLGIRQACRFQEKSFFKFLFSGETDLDKYKASNASGKPFLQKGFG
jgi:predicted RecB family nuclease